MNKILFLFATVFSLAACQNNSIADKEIISVQGIDTSLTPGNNFFMYANRVWYDTAQIPPSQAGVGAYMFMNYPQRLRLQGILDSVSLASNASGSIEQKLGDYYASGMDTTTINQMGYDPIKPILAQIDSIRDVVSFINFVAREAKVSNNSIIGFYVGPDNKNSNLNIAHIYQTGISLPERDYYFKTDASSIGIQEAYKNYVATMFKLTGSDAATAAKAANIVYTIEKELASAHKTNIELRDVNANYNKMNVGELAKP